MAEQFKNTPIVESIAEAALDIIEHGDSGERTVVWQLPWDRGKKAVERLLQIAETDRSRLDEIRGVPNVLWRLLQIHPDDPRLLALLRREASATLADPWVLEMAAKYAPQSP
ncbi:MAG TPA: hypothetical protein VMJ10_27315 [Kofleriaceae bacterium]|nr:hypothetical protein [Kofleriaceae bacterium]